MIADTLGIDEGTAKHHTHAIYEKTGFRSRTKPIFFHQRLMASAAKWAVS
jgi:DNA-binding NarL/FixJ family response regulator